MNLTIKKWFSRIVSSKWNVDMKYLSKTNEIGWESLRIDLSTFSNPEAGSGSCHDNLRKLSACLVCNVDNNIIVFECCIAFPTCGCFNGYYKWIYGCYFIDRKSPLTCSYCCLQLKFFSNTHVQ